ncbi:hypothetical protein SteCoe_35081 [Stentor coeruleus]|uniref:G domain-containing protein n=1 Tax=Stentor coeruleus TaxID=5963 RepID=A0A1R2AT37_9CILI|nr:hypothetical protein SteCoe_35081 [Stentor coeruleus]
MQRDINSAIDLQKLNFMIDQAEKKIIPIRNKITCFLGLTGAGKSTLMCFLLKLKPIVEIDDYGQIYIDFIQEEDHKIEIGHSSASCTELPNFRIINGEYYWDCPGLFDNKSIAQEILNLYCIKKIFESPSCFKIVIVVEYQNASVARGRDLANTLRQIVEMFPDQNNLFNCLSIIVTKCDKRNMTSEKFVRILDNLSRENNEFESAIPLLQMLSRAPQKIVIFMTPENAEDLNEELRNKIHACICTASFTKMPILNSLSDRAKLVIDNLLTLYENDIKSEMTKFSKKIFIKFRSETDMNALHQGKAALDDFLSIDPQRFTIQEFESGIINLSNYFTGSEALSDGFRSLTNKINFYNSYRSARSPPINLLSWINPIRYVLE